MVLPLFPVVAALGAGGQLVAHSAGGLIVLSSTGSYVAGTYISTAALASFLTGSAVAVGAGQVAVVGGLIVAAYRTLPGVAVSLIGGAGYFGTTVGATGITGFLMARGILPSTPILVPVSIALFTVLSILFLAFLTVRRIRQIRKKALDTPEGQEAHFSKRETKLERRP